MRAPVRSGSTRFQKLGRLGFLQEPDQLLMPLDERDRVGPSLRSFTQEFLVRFDLPLKRSFLQCGNRPAGNIPWICVLDPHLHRLPLFAQLILAHRNIGQQTFKGWIIDLAEKPGNLRGTGFIQVRQYPFGQFVGLFVFNVGKRYMGEDKVDQPGLVFKEEFQHIPLGGPDPNRGRTWGGVPLRFSRRGSIPIAQSRLKPARAA